MKKQAGFTLIELVIVIIILGILAVTAAPKFLNLQEDARNSTLKGMEGALNSAGAMVYSKAVLAGKEESNTVFSLPLDDNKNVDTLFGYPIATSAALTTVAEINTNDWQFGAQGTGNINIYPKGADITNTAECFVKYQQAVNENTPPVVTTTNCK